MKPNIPEALRYMGAARPTEELYRETERLAARLSETLQPRYVYRVCRLEILPDRFRLEGTPVELAGATAAKMLAGCRRAALLACTLGSRFDQLLRAVQVRDMAQAVILDALGSSFVEAGCGAAEEELDALLPGLYRTDRFSPGYGDLPLSLQPELCAALDACRRLGLTVTKSLLLNPVKSVTAVIGLSDTPQPARIRGCAFCSLAETCALRKGGNTCAP